MVPAKKEGFTSIIRIDKKGNRTRNYVFGTLWKYPEEGKSSTSTQKLREKNTIQLFLLILKQI